MPHAMKLNAMLTKNQIICCGMMNVSFGDPGVGHQGYFLLEFQPLTVTRSGDWSFVAARLRGLSGVGDGVLAPPHVRVGRELGHRWERTPQFAVVAVQIEPRADRGAQELYELAKPIAEGPLVAGQRPTRFFALTRSCRTSSTTTRPQSDLEMLFMDAKETVRSA